MRPIFTFLALLVASFSFTFGQVPELDIPAEVKPVAGYARIKASTDAEWVIYRGMGGVNAKGEMLPTVNPIPSEFLNDPRAFLLDAQHLAHGKYTFWAVGSVAGKPVQGDFSVLIGDDFKPPVVVIPPKPGPGPGPGPKPEPVVVGERVVMLFRESHQNNVAVADTIDTLRNGEGSKYLSEKKHSLYIFDPDDMVPTVLSWKPKFTGYKPPFVMVTKPDGAGKATLLGIEELPLDVISSDRVLDIVKKYGG